METPSETICPREGNLPDDPTRPFSLGGTMELEVAVVATNKEQFRRKVDRAHAVRIKAEAFVAAGGDLMSDEAVPLGAEMIDAWDDFITEFRRHRPAGGRAS